MTRLRLKLHQPEAPGYLEAGAVATVRRLADADGKVTKGWWQRDQPIRVAGRNAGPGYERAFELPSGGYYGVDVTLPRGPDLSLELFIPEGEDRFELIRMPVSPHEYLGWQQFAGIVRADPYQREKARGPGALGTAGQRQELLLAQSQSQIDALYDNAKPVPRVFAAEVPASAAAWQRVGSAAAGNRGWARAGGALDWPPQPDPELVAWFFEMPDGGEGHELVERLKTLGTQDPWGDDLARKFPRWLSFETDGQIDLASVPWAWWGEQRDDDEEIRFLYDLIRPSPVERQAPGHLTVSVQDRRWFALLEFLASGRLTRAGSVFEEVIGHEDPEAALHGKVKGPLVAVAGGIVLIARAQSTEPQHWDGWLENLSRWFPGIPDGAILLGCRRAAQAKDLGELQAAFDSLEEGVARGLPFFSATLRMLVVTLAQIGGDLPEADRLRRDVAPVASRVDPDQPFTVIRL